jgi:hydroxymethylbilane synthase
MSRVLTIATRRGELALTQTQLVAGMLRARRPELKIRIHEVASTGDTDRTTALWNLKDTGFFTSVLEEALLAGQADVAVHSFKDLPTRRRAGLAVTAICDRRWPEDCLLAKDGVASIRELPPAARVGTSSLRRAAQLRHLRPDVQIVALRGNVQTRIDKLRTTDLDAILLAHAGLERLGLGDVISAILDPKEFVPAPAQGTLGVQTRSDDAETVGVVRTIDDTISRAVSLAERQVLTTMRCGCHAPVGAYAESCEGEMEVRAFISDARGANMIRRCVKGPASEPVALGERVAEELLRAGGREILDELERERQTGDLRD